MKIIPHFGGYIKRQEVTIGADGTSSHRFVNVPKGDLAAWDATHDSHGRRLEARDPF